MERALGERLWDAICMDYQMPRFDALRALKVRGELAPDTPVIIVSGYIGETAAVALLKAGADDYIPKHNLARLAPALRGPCETSAIDASAEGSKRNGLACSISSPKPSSSGRALDPGVTRAAHTSDCASPSGGGRRPIGAVQEALQKCRRRQPTNRADRGPHRGHDHGVEARFPEPLRPEETDRPPGRRARAVLLRSPNGWRR